MCITGSHGCGEVALLEQLSQRARAGKRRVIYIEPRNPLGNIMGELVACDEAARVIDPELEAPALSNGGKICAGATPKTIRYSEDDFEHVLLEACSKAKYELFVSIDGAQKVSPSQISAISNAFQLASWEGSDVMLAVAGLPRSYEKAIRQTSCTSMCRPAHLTLGPLDCSEVVEAWRA